METMLFNKQRIVNYGDAPEIEATGTGYLELLPRDRIRIWLVKEHLPGREGLGGSELVARVTTPIAGQLMSRALTGLWFAQHGFHVPIVGGRGILIASPRSVM